jgi:hypothetical protein
LSARDENGVDWATISEAFLVFSIEAANLGVEIKPMLIRSLEK